MPRLSSSIDGIKPHYTVVVVGSGYGGGIAASRMARAGQAVCVLERGKEFQPGEYPDTQLRAAEEMQMDTPAAHVGCKTGLYDFRVNDDMNVFLGCGLGGTSLVNANVSLRAEPRIFADAVWPEAIRAEAAAIAHPSGEKPLLEVGYELAEQMLQPQPYPENYPPLPKLEAQAESAKGLNACFYRPPINVTFEDRINFAGVQQHKCTNCGDCVSGCNYGAKNTVLMNYLPDAKNHGAEIFTQTSIRYIERSGDKWVVHFNLLGDDREEFNAPPLFVTADIVVLSAGTVGSTEILLRSRQQGLSVSDALGKHFSSNGDVLGFAYNSERVISGIGYGRRQPPFQEPVGPCITGIIDMRERPQLNDGMVIEEGSIPGALAALMPAALASVATSETALGEASPYGADTLAKKIRFAARELESLEQGPYRGAVHNTQTYLVMTHDGSAGEMYLENDRLRIKWPGVGDEPIFQSVKQNLKNAADALAGTFFSNPIWSEILRHELITVHPLGGCGMADSAKDGVVNDRGEVFNGQGDASVHKGLYVSDGSVIPRSLGVNPLLTISGLAERCCQLIAKDHGWTINYEKKPLVQEAEEVKIGIQFTEKMAGYFSVNTTDSYEHGFEQGKANGSPMEFILTITSDDLDDMLVNPQHQARLAGTVTASALSPNPLAVSDGTFNLFVDNPQSVDTRNMWYRMRLTSEEGQNFFFEGFKTVDDTSMLHAWQQTTTLYVTVHEGIAADKRVLGKGILRIAPADFARQMTTMKVPNATSLSQRVDAVTRFGKFFAGVLWQSYGGVLAPESAFDPAAPPRRKRPLRVDVPEVHFFLTSDNVQLKLTRYRGGSKGPVILSHGLGVSSLIFSIDTIETNLLEYLFAHGFDVWLLDHRASIDLPASKTEFTADDVATKDYPAAVATMQQLTGSATVQIVAHCYGSATFTMAMLAGLQGVRSAVCSQISTHIVAPTMNRIRTGLHLPEFLDRLGVRSLTAYVDKNADWHGRLFDEALRLYPIPERCNNPVCHRITFMYAPLYRHEQLNEATHEALHEMFGIANVKAFEGLALMTRKGHVVAADGTEAYLPNLKRMAIPIAFIHGQENECFLPESTQITYDLLCQQNGKDLYTRHVIPGYGHIDCIFGKNTAVDVFPFILDHLTATAG